MTDTRNTIYVHRRNNDGSFDSICRTCFQTVARTTDEAMLAEHEDNHSYEHPFLAERGALSPITSGFFRFTN
jgi:hypothetical protein